MARMSPQEETFALLYVAGPDGTRGNGTECYLQAYGDHLSRQVAGASASRLLKRERVRARMRELRDEAEREARARLRSFMSEATTAQETLIRAMRCEWPIGTSDQDKRSAVESAKEWLARALGPTSKQDGTSGPSGVQVIVAQIANEREALEGQAVRFVALPPPTNEDEQ